MNQTNLPRRGFLLSAGLAALAPLAQAAPIGKLRVRFRPVPSGSEVPVTMRLTIHGQGSLFTGVTAHFTQPDGTRLPFFAWSGGASSSFTMPVAKDGLHLVLEGKNDQPVVLKAVEGTYEIRRGEKDETPLRIQLSAA
jgi:hypothetical protein